MWWWRRRCTQQIPRLGGGLWMNMMSHNNRRGISSREEPRQRFAALWGNGDYGRLGLSTLDSQWSPSVCSAFATQSLRAISCGGAHTLFLTEAGRVYSTGINDCGQLGLLDGKTFTLDPCEVSGLPEHVIHVSAGYHHSAAVTDATKVVSTPCRVSCLDGIRITMIDLGSEHSIAVTDDGEALSWGAGGSGRLGHGHQPSILGFLRSTSEYTPRLIKALEGVKVKTVSAGLLHSACISDNGSVFVFGERTVDKLGFGQAKNATSPSLIGELPLCQEVACGGYHTGIITIGGEVYTWGSNDNGCLGIGYTDVIHLPQRVQGPLLQLPVCQISSGWKHTAAISGGNVFTWGWGGSHGTFSVDGHSSGGQLGHGSDIDYFEPMMVNFGMNVKALQVSCGFNHTGTIKPRGRPCPINSFGQLTHYHIHDQYVMEHLQSGKLTSIIKPRKCDGYLMTWQRSRANTRFRVVDRRHTYDHRRGASMKTIKYLKGPPGKVD